MVKKSKQKGGTGQPTHHVVLRVVSAEPVRGEERRAGLRLDDVLTVAAGRGALDGEVPVRNGQLRVHQLQAVLERVGQHRVARQEPEAIVELLGGKARQGKARVTNKLWRGGQNQHQPRYCIARLTVRRVLHSVVCHQASCVNGTTGMGYAWERKCSKALLAIY